MLTSKQRAYLKKQAHDLTPIFQVGKGQINDNQIVQICEALEARELIKVKVLDTAMLDVRTCCDELCARTGADPVLCIGKIIVLYKRAKKEENRKIIL